MYAIGYCVNVDASVFVLPCVLFTVTVLYHDCIICLPTMMYNYYTKVQMVIGML